uniref:Family with sequence similarity 78 member B n=1 Tax=Equus asinus TaxID=9793 RepID=A0A8C4LP80_EQUAS
MGCIQSITCKARIRRENIVVYDVCATIDQCPTRIEETSPIVLRYKTPYFKASARVVMPPIPRHETWVVGWIQACNQMEFFNTYSDLGIDRAGVGRLLTKAFSCGLLLTPLNARRTMRGGKNATRRVRETEAKKPRGVSTRNRKPGPGASGSTPSGRVLGRWGAGRHRTCPTRAGLMALCERSPAGAARCPPYA